eukprot:Skav217272  [mRNA]  locus=scaffold120:66875:67684:- [translate_table: standard]
MIPALFVAVVQGCIAAFIAASLSALLEPIVNRLLVKRMTVSQALNEVNISLVMRFFLTTFPTNLLKFPAFEMINRFMSFTPLSPALSGAVAGWLFCTMMLPVTNYRFRRAMGWEIKPALLYQAYIPTVARDILYGGFRGLVGSFLLGLFTPITFFGKASVFGFTIWVACILSSPCNEWRGYALQPPDKKLPLFVYFKPTNYARSAGIGSTIMGFALAVGMLVTSYAGWTFGPLLDSLNYGRFSVGYAVGLSIVMVALTVTLFIWARLSL